MRLVFKERSKFLDWMEDEASPEKYNIFLTEENEIILVPKKSTRPIIYAYYKEFDAKEFDNLKANFSKSSYKVYEVKSVDWDDEKPVGVKVAIE